MGAGTETVVNFTRNWLVFIMLVGVLAYAVGPLFTELFTLSPLIENNILIGLGLLVIGMIVVASIFNPGIPQETEIVYDRPSQGGFVP